MCLCVTGVYRYLRCRCVSVLQECTYLSAVDVSCVLRECTDLSGVDVSLCYRSVHISQLYVCLCVTGVYRSISCRCVCVLQECTDLSAVDVSVCYRSVQISQV